MSERFSEASEQQSWQHAYVVAAERWGEQIGLSVAYLLTKVVRAVRSCRPNGLSVQDPLCREEKNFATKDEVALISMLHHMRRDETSDARNSVQILAFDRNDQAIIHAG